MAQHKLTNTLEKLATFDPVTKPNDRKKETLLDGAIFDPKALERATVGATDLSLEDTAALTNTPVKKLTFKESMLKKATGFIAPKATTTGIIIAPEPQAVYVQPETPAVVANESTAIKAVQNSLETASIINNLAASFTAPAPKLQGTEITIESKATSSVRGA